MVDDLVFMKLDFATDEPPVGTIESRTVLRDVDQELSAAGLNPSMVMHHRGGIQASVSHFGEYAIPIMKMTAAVAGVAIAWLHGRAGRKVRFKVGDVLIEARTREDVEALIDRVSETRKAKSSPTRSSRVKSDGPSNE